RSSLPVPARPWPVRQPGPVPHALCLRGALRWPPPVFRVAALRALLGPIAPRLDSRRPWLGADGFLQVASGQPALLVALPGTRRPASEAKPGRQRRGHLRERVYL